MFLKSIGSTNGAQQPPTALITFLAPANLVGHKLDKENRCVTLDYSGPFKFMLDIIQGFFILSI
jgi:hypothetical protein